MNSSARKSITKTNLEIPLTEWELPESPLIPSEMPLRDLVDKFYHEKLETALIAPPDGKEGLAGILTERDFLSKGLPLLQQKGAEFFELPASEIMTSSPKTLELDQTLLDAIHLMARGDLRHFPLVDHEQQSYRLISLRDIMTFVSKLFPEETEGMGTKFDWDLLEVHAQNEDFSLEMEEDEVSGNIFLSPLKKAIYCEALCCDLSERLESVLEKMREKKQGAVVITQYECLVKGIYTERDLIKDLSHTEWEVLRKQKMSDLMTAGIYTLLDKHVVSFALNNMLTKGHRRCIIVNEDSYPLAVVSMLDLLKFLNYQLFKG